MKHPNRLRELRLQRGISQADMATLLGVKQPTVNRHEQGNRSLDGFAIERYAKIHGVSPYELFVPVDHSVAYDDESDGDGVTVISATEAVPALA